MASQALPWAGIAARTIAQDDRTIDDHQREPDRILKWLFERRCIRDANRIENDHIRRHPDTKSAAIMQSKSRRRLRRQFPDRLLQREHLAFART